MSPTPSAIPVGTQFSPRLIDLGAFVEAVVRYSGDKPAMAAAVWSEPVRKQPVENAPTRRRQSLPLEAAVQYGLLDAGYEATDLARELAALPDTDIHQAFARHVMLNLGGLRVVEAAQQMAEDDQKVTGDSLAGYLTDQGFPVTVHNTAINSLRMWLAEAGVFPKGRGHRAWEVDQVAKERLVGMGDEVIAALVGLTDEQRAFAEALCRIEPEGWHPAADVRDLAEMVVGKRLDRANLPKTFLEPLSRTGLIEYKTGGTAGGKTSHLRTTADFDANVVHPFIENAVQFLDAPLTAYYRRRPEDIQAGLSSKDSHTKGQALEALAVWVMRLLGLRFVAWRKRAAEQTAHAEVDVLLAGVIGFVPTRWQVQCKNTPTRPIRLEDVAKEVGLSLVTKANIILMFANAAVTEPARNYAQEVMRHTALTVMILDKSDLDTLLGSPGRIASLLRREANVASRLDRYGTDWLSAR